MEVPLQQTTVHNFGVTKINAGLLMIMETKRTVTRHPETWEFQFAVLIKLRRYDLGETGRNSQKLRSKDSGDLSDL